MSTELELANIGRNLQEVMICSHAGASVVEVTWVSIEVAVARSKVRTASISDKVLHSTRFPSRVFSHDNGRRSFRARGEPSALSLVEIAGECLPAIGGSEMHVG